MVVRYFFCPLSSYYILRPMRDEMGMRSIGVVRRAGEFALSKPAREILFTVVAREEKYKAKKVIDTAVYRGGDMLSSWLVAALRGAFFRRGAGGTRLAGDVDMAGTAL